MVYIDIGDIEFSGRLLGALTKLGVDKEAGYSQYAPRTQQQSIDGVASEELGSTPPAYIMVNGKPLSRDMFDDEGNYRGLQEVVEEADEKKTYQNNTGD